MFHLLSFLSSHFITLKSFCFLFSTLLFFSLSLFPLFYRSLLLSPLSSNFTLHFHFSFSFRILSRLFSAPLPLLLPFASLLTSSLLVFFHFLPFLSLLFNFFSSFLFFSPPTPTCCSLLSPLYSLLYSTPRYSTLLFSSLLLYS